MSPVSLVKAKSLPTRLTQFASRHRGAVIETATRMALAQGMRREWGRKLVRPFLNPKEPETWAFLLGSYNSGTTILRQVLGAHPDICTLPYEGVRLTNAFPQAERDGWIRMWHRNAQSLSEWQPEPEAVHARASLDWSPWWPKDKAVYLEKSIAHTAWLDALSNAFPSARYIFVLRNGLCASEGLLRRAYPTDKAALSLGAEKYTPEEVAAQWVASNAGLLGQCDLPNNTLVVRYEEFCAHPVQILGQIFEHLGLDSSIVRMSPQGLLQVGFRYFAIQNKNEDSVARLSNKVIEKMMGSFGKEMERLGYGKQ